jgi:hypothetical protein
LGRPLGWALGRALGPLGWLGLGPPLGRMGLGRMARPILRLAPVRRRSLPASFLRRRLCGSNRRLRTDQRIFRPAAARSGLSRQGIYARRQRGVHGPVHPRRRCRRRRQWTAARWPAIRKLMRRDERTTRSPCVIRTSHANSPGDSLSRRGCFQSLTCGRSVGRAWPPEKLELPHTGRQYFGPRMGASTTTVTTMARMGPAARKCCPA